MTSTAHLVGRDSELASIDRGLAAVQAGHGWLAIVEGEAGIGKTRLLGEAMAAARECGFTVLSAAGYEIGHENSFAAIADALELRSSSPDPPRAALAELLRRSPGESQNLEFRLLEDILALVERLSIERPVLLAVDDLQWVDSPSLLALAHVVRHLEPLRVAVVAAVRSAPRRAQVDRFLRSTARTTGWLNLGPLPEDAVRSLVGELVGARPGASLLRLMAGADGNPLFVEELASALEQDGSLALVDGMIELSGRSLPPSILRLVERRLESVPGATADLLRLASILGSDFSLSLLADFAGRPAGRPAGELAATLKPALGNGLLGELGGHLTFQHQLVRDSIYQQMPLAVRSALHLQVGRLLARLGAEAAQVATHLSLGGEAGESEAVAWLRRAATEAASASPMQAVELLDRAGELAGARHPAREEILVDRALALVWAGRADQGLGAVREMLAAGVAAPLEDRLHLGMAQALLVQGRWAESVQEFERLAARHAPEAERARLLGDCALARAHCGDLTRAVALADEARRMGELLGDELARSIALSSLAVVAHFEARHLDSVNASREALALALHSRSPDAGLRPTALWLGLGLLDADRFDEALALLQAWRRRSEDAGMQWQLPLYDDGIATLHFYAGDWDDAVTEMETCMALARETGTLWWLVPANCMLAYIAIHRDQDELAAAAISTAERHSGSGALDFATNRVLWIGGLRHEARGDLQRALTALEGAWAATSAAHFLPHLLIIGPDLVRVAMAAGAEDRAGDVAARVEEIAARTGVPSAVALGHRCRGLADDDEDRLLEAVAMLRKSPRRVEQAFASEDAGTGLARKGRIPDAVGLLDEALSEYRRLGARRDAARVVAVLRSLGARRSRVGHAPRPALGWEALTPTELRVVELASQGLTNPEVGSRLFVSRRTVATHMSHVFDKLEISSRVDLARVAQERRQRP